MKASDVVFEKAKSDSVSRMLDAIKGISGSIPMDKPSGQFGRVVKITTDSGLAIDNALDIEFEVPFDDDTEANEATITVYNLTDKTIGLLKTDDEISITAGYGKDTGVIFVGVITKVKTEWKGSDKVTTINTLDDVARKDQDVASISFSARTRASYVLKTLVGKLALPIAVFETRKDFTYTEAVTVSGGLMSNIEKYAEVCGVSAYINKRKVYVRHISDGDNLGFEVNEKTGLVGSPEEFTEESHEQNSTGEAKGVTFKMLLEHRITTASIVTLKSRNHSGKYRVREGKHICNENDFYTEVTAIE